MRLRLQRVKSFTSDQSVLASRFIDVLESLLGVTLAAKLFVGPVQASALFLFVMENILSAVIIENTNE